MNSRLAKFHSLRNHIVIGTAFRSLGKNEVALCEKFILENAGLDDNAFALKVNRWFLGVPADQRPSDKKMTAMWALVSQSIEVKIHRRGEK